ncbi:S26 family signal peptidase [Arthrobacter roseus]|uniref:S26 family signal peptidase n=1 Tax=Arthrobacter roseus TaxID=136274 RepID=UPI001964EFD3|nr:S26 family signal peptidase [Arthrobacter roseus]MBM7848963.1 signal peptidase I [Arthrobacter roseus]
MGILERQMLLEPEMTGSNTVAMLERGTSARRRTGKPSRPSAKVLLPIFLALVVGLLVLVAALGYLGGMRWFIISTPSMGEAAPVGTLIVTAPVDLADLEVGDIVTFRPPPAPSQVYTHRVEAAAEGGGLHTRGDINGAADPWILHENDIVGEAQSVLPGVGWLIRALPMVLVGSCLLWFLTRLVSDAGQRTAWRILGLSLVVSIPAVVLRPFVGLDVLTTRAQEGGVEVTAVSTGMLPISVEANGGTSTQLVSGEVGTVLVPSLTESGEYHLASSLDLGPAGWAVLAVVCVVPLLWCLVVGLPPVAEEDADTHGATEGTAA